MVQHIGTAQQMIHIRHILWFWQSLIVSMSGIYKVDWPFDVLEAPPAFAPGFCTISPHLPVIPAKTPVILVPNSTGSTVTRYVSEEPTTAAEVITLCSRSFPPEVERELLRSPKAREINAREVFATATVKQYSAQEIVIELGHEFC